MVNLQLVREHLRLDDNVEDSYVSHLITVATTYATARTNVLNDGSSPLYEHAVLLLIGHWHAQRESVSEGNQSKIPFGVDSLLYLITPVQGLIGVAGETTANTEAL